VKNTLHNYKAIAKQNSEKNSKKWHNKTIQSAI
jgi:hypothetical protein